MGADFAQGGVACALAGAPHVPGGDRAVRPPAFTEFQKFFGRRHVLFAVGDGPALPHAEVVDGKFVVSPPATSGCIPH